MAKTAIEIIQNETKKIRTKAKKRAKGLKIERFYTTEGVDPLKTVEYELRTSKIVNPDGTVVFKSEEIEVPKQWSRVASDVLISKYIRKKGVPQYDKNGQRLKDENGKTILGSEKSVKQVIKRLAGCWRYWGEKHKYFASSTDADIFEQEMQYMLVHQMGAPNSPQWFNTGLNQTYGITGPAQGHWYADPETGRLKQSEDAYTRPQPHACFIQSVKDDLVNEGGIFDLMLREARIFKYGSGSGSNFSYLRGEGEPLSGGGVSSGLMSWLEILDRGAGAIKSGGTTRRASKMVILNVDHPDVEKLIDWKSKEEEKAFALMEKGYSTGFEGEAYRTIAGQNSNNSIRVNFDFMKAVEEEGDWSLVWRTDPTHIAKTVKARDLWKKIATATWRCGDPGVQYDTTVNDWHTCLSSGRINGSNPCSEFMFLDDSSCNLASLNLLKFYDEKSKKLDITAFSHASRLWTIVLEISVLMAQFPSYEIAKNSYLFRPLGLGYANLGALLMAMGLAYDSDAGRAVSAGITSLMTGVAYSTSAEMAKDLGPFKMYAKNKQDMLRVIRNHRRAAFGLEDEYENLSVRPWKLDEKNCPEYLLHSARESWDAALLDGGRYGFKNAQVTLLAPTGTIGLVMDCDTTGIEPDYALVKFKKLAGGGFFKIINQSVPRSLENLGYSKKQIDAIIKYIIGQGDINNAPHINTESLLKKGIVPEDLERINKRLPGCFEISQAFTSETISHESLKSTGLSQVYFDDPTFNLLAELGFSRDQINEANDYVCGMMTIEGSPELKDEHLSIFDCANRCGQYGQRFIAPEGHIAMMAATQPFLSGAISKTVNLPGEATAEDIADIYMKSWKYALKAVAIYRDGSKHSQPLTSKDDNTEKEEKQIEKEIIVEYKPVRKRLPKERMSITRKVTIGGHKIYFTVGLYKDGSPGEIFVAMNQQGSFAAGMADSFAKMASIGLQYGVPIETIIRQLKHTRFSPMGFTGDSDIPNVSSVSDLLARWLEIKFVAGGVKAMRLPFSDNAIEKEEESDKEVIVDSEEDAKIENKMSLSEELGYSGETCAECGSNMMVQNGKCHKCVNCGATTGCS